MSTCNLPNGQGKNAAPDNETCPARFPLPNPLPQAGEGANESLRGFHINANAVFIHEDIDDLSLAVAQRIAAAAAQAIAARGVFNLVLAGGETPRRCYEKLRDLAIDWAHVQLYIGDERCLPEGDAQRNDTMIRATLLEYIAIPPGNIHFIPSELGANAAAADYAATLEQVAALDMALLGMGEDGHTASLFPDNPASENAALAVPVFNSPKPPPERVSIGLDTLSKVRQKLFLVAGAGKRSALEQMSRGILLPAARVKNAEWHIDRAALPPA
ncbi:MAG: 6-phosphogluconolactonase [Gallionella sp.]|nr:6-phosphogluconolactonase [Gallionella sp.]